MISSTQRLVDVEAGARAPAICSPKAARRRRSASSSTSTTLLCAGQELGLIKMNNVPELGQQDGSSTVAVQRSGAPASASKRIKLAPYSTGTIAACTRGPLTARLNIHDESANPKLSSCTISTPSDADGSSSCGGQQKEAFVRNITLKLDNLPPPHGFEIQAKLPASAPAAIACDAASLSKNYMATASTRAAANGKIKYVFSRVETRSKEGSSSPSSLNQVVQPAETHATRRLWKALGVRLDKQFARRNRQQESLITKASSDGTQYKLARIQIPACTRKSIVIPLPSNTTLAPLKPGLPTPRRIAFRYHCSRKDILVKVQKKPAKIKFFHEMDPAKYLSKHQRRHAKLERRIAKQLAAWEKRGGRRGAKKPVRLPSCYRALDHYKQRLPTILEELEEELGEEVQE